MKTIRIAEQDTNTGLTIRVLAAMGQELADVLAAMKAVVAQYDTLAEVHGLRCVAGIEPLL
jgi:hypothetical protein